MVQRIQPPCTYGKKYLLVDKDNIWTYSKLKQREHLKGIFGKMGEFHNISLGLGLIKLHHDLERIGITPSEENKT